MDGFVGPIRPSASTLFGPRGVCLTGSSGPMFVCDTGHHRLLVWTDVPDTDGTPADLLIGQSDFTQEGRNAKGDIGRATLNVPTGVCAVDGIVAVADAWNHRVLVWHGYPTRCNQPADIVLGQDHFGAGLANRGTGQARADTLNWCYGVAICDGRLIVADTGNRRVLIWDGIPQANGAPADLVLGQGDFNHRDEGCGEPGGPVGMRWPHDICIAGDLLMVSDAGDNRVMAWRGWPMSNGSPCEFVLGQAEMSGQDHNRGAYHPTAGALNMPYGVAAGASRLVVADTANSRLLGFDVETLAMGVEARWLAGQPTFADKGDNRWAPPARDSVCWPYGVSMSGSTVAIADSGNNRLLLWEAV
jgi:hypothetical protein